MTFSRPLALALLLAATPVFAQAGGWGERGWNRGSGDRASDIRASSRSRDRSREGRVEVTRFVTDGALAAALGHGPVTVTSQTGDEGPPDELGAYEAAVIDQLVDAGYDTLVAAPEHGQLAELTITRSVVEPPEAPRKPVSGVMDVGVSNRGSSMGMAINIDMTKPRAALLGTRLAARIRDRASGTILWEGHADIATREGDEDWSQQAIARQLATALFGGFPGKSGESFTVR